MAFHGDDTRLDLADTLFEDLNVVLLVILDLGDVRDYGLLIVVLLVAQVALQEEDFRVLEAVLHPFIGNVRGQDHTVNVVNLADSAFRVLNQDDVDVSGEVHRVV